MVTRQEFLETWTKLGVQLVEMLMPEQGVQTEVKIVNNSAPVVEEKISEALSDMDPSQICGRSKAAAATEPKPEPVSAEPGMIRDGEGNVIRLSTQKSDPGYDPEIHENTNLKILCDGKHYPSAHTADVSLGTVWYYEKNAAGRIKTLTAQGKVEIQGL